MACLRDRLAQVAFYGLGFIGWKFDEKKFGKSKIFTIPFFFCMVNLSSLLATLNVMRGRKIKRWETHRQEDETTLNADRA